MHATTTKTTPAEKAARRVEEHTAALKSARAALARAVADDDTNAENLARTLVSVAEAEGALECWTGVAHLLAHGQADSVHEFLLDRLGNGAGDTWSGRSNDVRRARFDGFRLAASRVRFLI